MAKPGVMLYFSVLPALDILQPASAGTLLLAAMHYAQDGREPVFEDRTLDFAWAFLKPSIDRDGEAYDEKRLRGAWMTYCRQCKRDGHEPLEFEAWRQHTDTEPLHTDTNTIPISVSISVSVSDSISVSNPNESDGADKPPAPSQAQKECGFGPALTEAFGEWLRYKREKRQGYKPTGEANLVAQVRGKAQLYGEDAVAALIRQSMASNYQGIVWDWLDKKPAPSKPRGGNVFLEILREETGQGELGELERKSIDRLLKEPE